MKLFASFTIIIFLSPCIFAALPSGTITCTESFESVGVLSRYAVALGAVEKCFAKELDQMAYEALLKTGISKEAAKAKTLASRVFDLNLYHHAISLGLSAEKANEYALSFKYADQSLLCNEMRLTVFLLQRDIPPL